MSITSWIDDRVANAIKALSKDIEGMIARQTGIIIEELGKQTNAIVDNVGEETNKVVDNIGEELGKQTNSIVNNIANQIRSFIPKWPFGIEKPEGGV